MKLLWLLSASLTLASATTFTPSQKDASPALDVSRVAQCNALKNTLRLENTTILDVQHITGPVNISTPGSCQSVALVSSSVCRVFFVINTTSTSAVHAEAWLPDTWFGRFLGLGNGGKSLSLGIDYSNLDYGSSLHFASVGSDNGHDGNSGIVFLNHPEVINDFAFRAIHVEAVIGKQIVEHYYGKPQHKSYYLGCSTGGRQGTQEALKFPDDFDGIVAGSPATDWNHLQGWGALLATFIGAPHPNTSASFIPPSLFTVISAEILRQCDGLDRVIDGIITEPDECIFRPEAIQCPAGTTTGVGTTCATEPQVEALKKIYTPIFGMEGQLIYPRLDPGAEADGGFQSLLSGSFVQFALDWYKFAVFNNSNLDLAGFGLQDIAIADAINPGGIAWQTRYGESFRPSHHRSLVIPYPQCQLISSDNSKRVYDLVSRTLAMPTLDSFYRLFLVPGMDHCIGGPGATFFGQNGIASNAINDTTHNALLAMVDWVERGIAPNTMTGVSTNGTQRTHCRYPIKSVFDGKEFTCISVD